jgi:SAM-dependent methyltransferase
MGLEPNPNETAGGELPEHVAANREAWDRWAADYVAAGEREWALRPGQETWGIFSLPESAVGMLPDDLEGLDTIELGCGTAYVSAWLARRGARPVGIDNSPKQLETAARLQREHGITFPLYLGSAEEVPLPDASFDFAISEYGAVLWADPERWVAEAARLLRPGGRLHVLTTDILVLLASPEDPEAPVEERLLRPLFGQTGRIQWDDEGVEFHLSHGEWIDVFTRNGFEIQELREHQVPEGAETRYAWMPYQWARKWPCEETWKVRKRA